MFCPTVMLLNARYGYISVDCGCDYRDVPARILWNPLRWEIGIGPRRPCAIRINKGGKAHLMWSNFQYRYIPNRRQRDQKARLAEYRMKDLP